MALQVIKAQTSWKNKEGVTITKEGSCSYDFGADLAESVKMFGEKVVHSGFISDGVLAVQAGVRACLKKGVDPAAWAKGFKPGVRTMAIAVDPLTAAKNALANMDPEARKAFLNELKALAK